MTSRLDDPEIATALREAEASYLSPEGANYLRRRLAMGACIDRERGRYNLGGLRNLRFGSASRRILATPGEGAMSGETITEHQRAYRRGFASWLPEGAIPGDAAERVRLFEERRAYAAQALDRALSGAAEPGKVVPGEAPVDVCDLREDDLLGVGLASFPSLRRAAQELVRVSYRAHVRDWSKIGEKELVALDSYPPLRAVAIPGAIELTAPLGWVPGKGPSEAAEETFRKLSADWEAFEVLAGSVHASSARAGIDAVDVAAWRSAREAWRLGTFRPSEVGHALLGEIERAKRIRASLVNRVAAAAKVEEGEPPEEESNGVFGWMKRLASREMIVAGGAIAAIASFFLIPSSSEGKGDGKSDPEPKLSPRVLPTRIADATFDGIPVDREDIVASDPVRRPMTHAVALDRSPSRPGRAEGIGRSANGASTNGLNGSLNGSSHGDRPHGDRYEDPRTLGPGGMDDRERSEMPPPDDDVGYLPPGE